MADMNAIENKYRTIGTIAVVLAGEDGDLEVYIAGSNKEWNALGTSTSDVGTASLQIHTCTQDEVSEGLPNIDSPDENTIYLVPASEESGNLYDEYLYVGENWEKFGSANIDLSGYAPVANPVFTGSISRYRTSDSAIGANSVAIGCGTSSYDSATASG